MPKNAGIAISAGIAIFFSGCDNSTAQLATSSFDSDEAAPLVATIASIDRGSVHVGSIVEQAFVLRAWDKGPVKVKSSVTNCCSGNGLIPDLTGQVLDPGSETLVSLKLYGAGVGRESVSAKIYCEGREVPIEIALSVTYTAIPIISPNPVIMIVAGEELAEANLQLTYRRTSIEKPFDLNLSGSSFGPFEIDVGEVLSHPAKRLLVREDSRVVDQMNLKIKLLDGTPLIIGDNLFTMSLDWGPNLPPSVFPVTVRKIPVISPTVGAMFCGILEAKQIWVGELEFRRHRTSDSVTIKSMVSDHPQLSVRLDPTGLKCHVTITAGDTMGREEAIIRVLYSDSSVSERKIPVSWIVKIASDATGENATHNETKP